MFTKTYLPAEQELKGQEQALTALKTFLTDPKGKAAFLYGPVGCGKTSCVYALAQSLEKEVFEVNASDVRNKDQINELIGAASQQHSLLSFGKGKIILIDELDGISGVKDRGGIPAIIDIIKTSSFPIILAAEDAYHKKFSSLRKKCMLIECQPLSYESIAERLKEICTKEHITFQEEVVRDLARRAGGDMRAALTDLELLTAGTKQLNNLEALDGRKQTESMQSALMRVFKTTNSSIAKDAFQDVDEDIDQQLLWIDENLPKEYQKSDLAPAYKHVARANIFLSRIRRWQHYRFYVYAQALLTAGVASVKQERNTQKIVYKKPSRILKMWIAKNKYKKRDDIAEKLSIHFHTSQKRIREQLPFMKAFAQKLPDLSDEEREWLQKV